MMIATLSFRSLLLSSALLGGALVLSSGLLCPASASAQSPAAPNQPNQPTPAQAKSEQGAVSSPALMVCTISGEAVGKPDTLLFESRTGGNALAKLTGASLPLKVAHVVPPGGGRVKVTTGTAKQGYLRIEGWADVDAFRFYAGRDLPIAGSGGHVSIARGQTLRIKSVKSDKMTVVQPVLGSSQQVRAAVSCPDASLTFPTLQADDVPERARTYQMRRNKLELYNGPRGDVIFTLELDEDTRTVFWSNEYRAGYIHVHSRSDLVIDAWVKAYEVVPLRHAEVFDPTLAGPKPPKARTLALQDPPKLVTATQKLTIRRNPRSDARTLGLVEKGARFYPMEQTGDWTNVMPHNLGVLPSDKLGFWVKTADLPKGG